MTKDTRFRPSGQAARDYASEYIARGWAPIPVPWRSKNPGYDGWQHLRVTADTLHQYFNGTRQNVGVLLGDPSGGLVDIDLDCPEVLIAARHFLPDTECVFGPLVALQILNYNFRWRLRRTY